MKCKHGTSVLKCESCVLGVLIKCEESIKKKSCFVNAFMCPGVCTVSGCTGSISGSISGCIGPIPFGYNAEATHLISTFTSSQLSPGTSNSILCRPLPITGTYLQLGACKSPMGWGLGVERDQVGGPYAYLQTPKCCSGCYSFNLSASVTLTGLVGGLSISLDILGLPVISVTPGIETSIPITFDLGLCQVAQETQYTNRTMSLSRRTLSCIQDAPCASTTFSPPTSLGLNLLTIDLPDIVIPPIEIPSLPPIVIPPIMLPSISIPLPIPSFTPGIHPINLSTNGIICLKDCSRLVPCITIRGVQIAQLISLLGIEVSLISGPFNLRVTCLSLSLKKIKHDPNGNCGCDYINPCSDAACGKTSGGSCSFGTCC